MTLATSINELFLTDGLVSYLGLVILAVILFGIITVKKEFVIIALPIFVLMGLAYLDAGLGWHFIISIVSIILMLVDVAVKRG